MRIEQRFPVERTSTKGVSTLLACVSIAAVSIGAISSAVRADITGFALDSITPNYADSGTLMQPFNYDSGTNTWGGLRITTGGTNQVRSVWFSTRQAAARFEVQYTYQITVRNFACCSNRDGVAFVMHNAAGGLNTLGACDIGGFRNIPSSVGFVTQVWSGGNTDAMYFNGVNGVSDHSTSPVNPRNGNPIRIRIRYENSLLSVWYTDLTTGDVWHPDPTFVSPSIPTRIGSADAVVGFTAMSCNGALVQEISNFSFTSLGGPPPPPCPADFNGDGVVDLFDYLDFVQAFSAGC